MSKEPKSCGQDQIVITREFRHVGDCSFCEGIVFYFNETVAMLGEISREDRRQIRQRVADGLTWEELLHEFDIPIETFEVWSCEKCGHTDSSPTKGGM